MSHKNYMDYSTQKLLKSRFYCIGVRLNIKIGSFPPWDQLKQFIGLQRTFMKYLANKKFGILSPKIDGLQHTKINKKIQFFIFCDSFEFEITIVVSSGSIDSINKIIITFMIFWQYCFEIQSLNIYGQQHK